MSILQHLLNECIMNYERCLCLELVCDQDKIFMKIIVVVPTRQMSTTFVVQSTVKGICVGNVFNSSFLLF